MSFLDHHWFMLEPLLHQLSYDGSVDHQSFASTLRFMFNRIRSTRQGASLSPPRTQNSATPPLLLQWVLPGMADVLFSILPGCPPKFVFLDLSYVYFSACIYVYILHEDLVFMGVREGIESSRTGVRQLPVSMWVLGTGSKSSARATGTIKH